MPFPQPFDILPAEHDALLMLENRAEVIPATRRPPGARASVIVGLFLGVALWMFCDTRWTRSSSQLTVYAIAVALCFVVPVQRGIRALSAQMDRRGTIRTAVVFLIIVILSMAFLYSAAIDSRRQWMPAIHDEFSYLLQARMLASGHLSMPAHPLGAFFDTFYVITDRAYASQYFPGTALFFLPGIWLGAQPWATSLLLAGLAAGMLFLVMRDLFSAGPALASVAMLWSVMGYRFFSVCTLSQMPALLLGLTAVFCALRWMSGRRLAWIACAGSSIGWLAVVRPLDAVAYAIPLGGLLVFTTIRDRASIRARLAFIAVGVLPMVPFAVLQLAINHTVTGSVLQTPFSYYADRDLPGVKLGFHREQAARAPLSSIPQKQVFYREEIAPFLKRHTPAQVLNSWFFGRTVAATGIVFGDRLLLALVPLALLTMRDPRQWAIASILPMWCLLYSFYPLFYLHYLVAVLASVPVVVFAGFAAIRRQFPHVSALATLELLLPAAISVMVYPQFNAARQDGRLRNDLEPLVRKIESEIDGRAILLIRWGGDHAAWESVYNIDVAWPDDARVIRVHDLGDANMKLFDYYARREPDRVVYRLDRTDGRLARLGNVIDLAREDAGPSTVPAD